MTGQLLTCQGRVKFQLFCAAVSAVLHLVYCTVGLNYGKELAPQ